MMQQQDQMVKPCGIPMHATLDNAVENLAAAFSERLFVTHRLDVPTSGLVLLAKTKDYQVVFNNLLLAGEVNKTYQVLTLKEPPLGRLINGMRVEDRAPKKIISYADFTSGNHEKSEQYIHCELEIISTSKINFDMGRPVPTSAPGFLSLVKLITGRTHQIRAQFSFAGCPIVGDEMYGGMPSSIFGLHSARLSFTDPLLKKK
jgi:23S rRNA pseudouridine1911/1915/1917 synthase